MRTSLLVVMSNAIFLLLTGGCDFANAQVDSTGVSPDRIKWVLSLDSRSTIIQRKHITINGALAGLTFGQKKHKLTAGYYWLNYGSKQRLVGLRKKIAQSVNLKSYARTDVSFVSFAYWYPLYSNKTWTVQIPVEMGIGQESARYRQISDDSNLGNKNFFFGPYQLGVYCEYRLSRWFGLEAQVGYRDAVHKGPFRRHFKGSYYSYGLTLYPDMIYKDVKDKLFHKRDN